MPDSRLCPCGSKKEYDSCCGPFHNGTDSASTAEQLMRSRYSAFALNNADYLVATHHPSKQAPNEKQRLVESLTQSEWLELKVIATEDGTAKDTTGFVEFAAKYQDQSGTIDLLCERSRFIKENSRWFYLDGEIKDISKLGRNDPCWCGSGKKYKKCHG